MQKNPALIPFCIECGFEQMSSEEKAKAQIVPGAIDELKRHFSKIREN
jgi:hypothetical protein